MENSTNPNDSTLQDPRRKARLERLTELGKLTGIPAGNYSPPNKPEPLPLPAIDWELWAYMPKATLAETVAVSLGLDPSAIKPRSGYAEPGKEFDRRLKLACAYVSHAGPLKSLDALPPIHLIYGPATATVSLPQFAEWALSMGWALPEKFPRFRAKSPQVATDGTSPATQTPLHVAVQRIVKSELQKLNPAPVVVPVPKPAPVLAGGKKWTPEKLAELKAYREAHTMPETAEKFGITEQRIRQLLPSQKTKPKPYSSLIHRMK